MSKNTSVTIRKSSTQSIIIEAIAMLIMAWLIKFTYSNVASFLNWPIFSYWHWLASMFVLNYVAHLLK